MRLTDMARTPLLVACTEEAPRIGQMLECEIAKKAESGTKNSADPVLLSLCGEGPALHRAWRLCQILLEYACGMATYAQDMLAEARMVNPQCEIFVTRKSFPFAKGFCIRAMLAGGVLPHRLGLSETVLVFGQHHALFASDDAFLNALRTVKTRCVEKKLVVEVESVDAAQRMLALGVDVVQIDKCKPADIKDLVVWQQTYHPHATLLAAGGIHLDNTRFYAATGVHGLVTSAPYQAGMANLGANLVACP